MNDELDRAERGFAEAVEGLRADAALLPRDEPNRQFLVTVAARLETLMTRSTAGDESARSELRALVAEFKSLHDEE